MFLYITAIPPPLLPLSDLYMLKPYLLIMWIILPESFVSQDSVMNAISTPSRACITLSVLLHIERTFHSRQEIEFIVVGGGTCFLSPDNMECYLLSFSVLSGRLGIWERSHCVLYFVDFPFCSLYSCGVRCQFCDYRPRIRGPLHHIFHRQVLLNMCLYSVRTCYICCIVSHRIYRRL